MLIIRILSNFILLLIEFYIITNFYPIKKLNKEIK